MRRLRSMAAQSPAIVISVLALLFSLGSGTGYAVALMNGNQIARGSIPASRLEPHSIGSPQLKATTITFHKLHLINGWESGPVFGAASYAISGGVVYLAGAVAQPTGNESLCARLPKAARPRHNLEVVVETYTGAGDLHIGTNGNILCDPAILIILKAASQHGPASSGGQQLTSFAGVSFPVTS
jgi:hypothetical protein